MGPKSLAELLAEVDGGRLVRGDPATPVYGVSNDTRSLAPGEVFVAVPGFQFDGLQFVPQAVSLGASAIVCETADLAANVPVVAVASARRALADLAAAFFDHPSRSLSVVGI